jgi:hypothetical protein
MENVLIRALRVTTYHGPQMNCPLSEQAASLSQGYPWWYCRHALTRHSELCYNDSLISWSHLCFRSRETPWIFAHKRLRRSWWHYSAGPCRKALRFSAKLIAIDSYPSKFGVSAIDNIAWLYCMLFLMGAVHSVRRVEANSSLHVWPTIAIAPGSGGQGIAWHSMA